MVEYLSWEPSKEEPKEERVYFKIMDDKVCPTIFACDDGGIPLPRGMIGCIGRDGVLMLARHPDFPGIKLENDYIATRFINADNF